MSEENGGLRDRQRLERRQHILEAAWSLLGQRGYEGWTLEDLAGLAGMSRRTLYLHFASKEEIAAETIAKNLLLSVERVQDLVVDRPPGEALRAVILWFVTRHSEPRPIPVGSIKSEPGLMAAVRTFPVYQSAWSSLRATMADLLARGQSEGVFTKSFSSEVLAELVLEMLRGIDPSRWPNDEVLSEASLAVLLDGVRGGQR